MRTLTTKEYKFVDPPFYALPGMNPKYTAIIHCPDKRIMVAASLPPEISFSFRSTYGSSYRDQIPGSSVLNEFEPTYNVFGGSFNTKALTSRVWQGGGPVSFTLDLNFVYENDMEADVRKPISDLMRLVVAEEKEAGDLLGAPGPYLDAKKLVKSTASDIDAAGTAASNKAKGAYKAGVNAAEKIKNSSLGATFDKLKSAGSDLVSSTTNLISGASASKAADAGITAWEKAAGVVKEGFKYVSNKIDEATINKTSLLIGEHWLWPSIIVEDVTLTSKTLPTRNGVMKIVVASVQISTFTVPTSRDIDRMFAPLND